MNRIQEPDGLDSMDYEMKLVAICNKNTTDQIRKEIDSIVGLDSSEWDEYSSTNSAQFKKEQLAEIMIALGGPQ